MSGSFKLTKADIAVGVMPATEAFKEAQPLRGRAAKSVSDPGSW
jgi:hypothetical protein